MKRSKNVLVTFLEQKNTIQIKFNNSSILHTLNEFPSSPKSGEKYTITYLCRSTRQYV